MADSPARTEGTHGNQRGSALGVTTGAIRGSRKIHVPAPANPDVKVAMREIMLEPGCGEPPLRVYDPSGPYTDAGVAIDITKGLAELRAGWIRGRGDVEEVAQREVRPEDNGLSGPRSKRRRRSVSQRAPHCTARAGWRQRQPDALCPPGHHHARNGICRDPRKSRPRVHRWPCPRRRRFRCGDPRLCDARVRPRRSGARPGDHPQQHQPPRKRADGDRAQFPRQDQRQYRQFGGRVGCRQRSRQDGVVDPLGRGHGDGPVDRAQHPRHARMDHPQFAGPDRHRANLSGARKGRRRRRGSDLGHFSRHADRTGAAGGRLFHDPRGGAAAVHPAHRQTRDRHRQPRRQHHGQMVPVAPQGKLSLRTLRRHLRDHEGV